MRYLIPRDELEVRKGRVELPGVGRSNLKKILVVLVGHFPQNRCGVNNLSGFLQAHDVQNLKVPAYHITAYHQNMGIGRCAYHSERLCS